LVVALENSLVSSTKTETYSLLTLLANFLRIVAITQVFVIFEVYFNGFIKKLKNKVVSYRFQQPNRQQTT